MKKAFAITSIAALAVAGGIAFGTLSSAQDASRATTADAAPTEQTMPSRQVTIWRDPNCGCCDTYAEYLESKGYHVTRVDDPGFDRRSVEVGVPQDGIGCHLAEIDGYYVEASDEVIPATGLMYTLLLRDLDRGLPVDDAEVEITARAGERVVGPTSTVRFANAYSVLIPDDGQDEWTADVRIARPSRGVTTFSHTIVGISGDDGTVWWATPPITRRLTSISPATTAMPPRYSMQQTNRLPQVAWSDL